MQTKPHLGPLSFNIPLLDHLPTSSPSFCSPLLHHISWHLTQSSAPKSPSASVSAPLWFPPGFTHHPPPQISTCLDLYSQQPQTTERHLYSSPSWHKACLRLLLFLGQVLSICGRPHHSGSSPTSTPSFLVSRANLKKQSCIHDRLRRCACTCTHTTATAIIPCNPIHC